MKYFSESWLSNSALSDAEVDAVRDAYWNEIEAIKSELSPSVLELATKLNLHDGLVKSFELDRAVNRLTIILRCGDLQAGYSGVELTYSDVDTTTLDSALLKIIATDPETELLYDEVGLASPGCFVHRIIFSPIREIEVVFCQLTVAVYPQTNRELGANSHQYREN